MENLYFHGFSTNKKILTDGEKKNSFDTNLEKKCFGYKKRLKIWRNKKKMKQKQSESKNNEFRNFKGSNNRKEKGKKIYT